ncbi:MAG: flagellar biosynthetic protein FliR [Edaphobacter sp.]|uniref:flagellar biosynthetic protein FliR n=1 Tax=Edaphobacter sp. TaxID=1934404 RepID=UPI00238D325A|nr:flagellar biosynthetic protein FliR [Edaphobacter sp.]MDE1178383.1 flagellar biosynthetic protein FliR [Edaphobacter sp.]
MQGATTATIADWPQYLASGLLVMIRLSGLMVFAPVFSSSAIAPRIKVGFVVAMTIMLAPVVGAVTHQPVELGGAAIVGELSVGFVFGLSLMLLNEALLFAGTLLGMQFSFSLVNLMDPNSMIETPVLGQMLGWLGVLVLIGAGMDRTMLAAMMRSFVAVPVGHAAMGAKTGATLAAMGGGIFLAGLQLAAPVMAAAMTVEMTISLIGRLSPQLPAMVVGIPLKTMASYVVLIASLAVWPGWIEHHFTLLLEAAGRLVGMP